jgi:ferric-dicitrate binding protein FerR (iron transport regulator)
MTDRDRSRHNDLEEARDGVDIGPIDPDIALLERWLAHELPADEARAVEERLVEDGAFFDKAAPIIRIWNLPVRFRTLLERPEPELAERRAVTRHRPSSTRHSQLTARPRRRARFLTTFKRGAVAMFTHSGPVLAIAVMAVFLYVRYDERARDRQTTAFDQAPHQQVPNGTEVKTGPGETRTISLRGGARVVVRHDSRFTYAYVAASRSMMATLDGEAAIDLTKEEAHMMVRTSSGRVILTPGSYAIRCEPGCAAMLVTVGAGVANIRSDTGSTGLTLSSGDRGRVPKRGSPEKVIPGDGWPAIEPPLAPLTPPTTLPARPAPLSRGGWSPVGVAPSAARGRTR